jgi:hypothetical protein
LGWIFLWSNESLFFINDFFFVWFIFIVLTMERL